MNLLGTSSWDSVGICFNSTAEDEIDEEELCAEFRNHFAVVFVEVHSKLNLCHSITIDLYNRLKYDATIAVGQLNQINVDIHSLFSCPVDFHLYFDYYIKYEKPYFVLVQLAKIDIFLFQRFDRLH